MKKILFYIIPFLLFITCTRHLTEPKVYSLTGTVTLKGQSDFTGITVELYQASIRDTAITNFLARYPNVGIDVSRDILFDHRLEEPAYSTSTDEDGNFLFSDIPEGDYNLVAEKRGFGWRYIYSVAGTKSPELKLFPEMSSSGVIDTYTVWPAHQHVIVNGNLTIQQGGTLLIDKGCVIRMGGNYEIKGDGAIQVNGTADAMVWFTADVPSREPGYTAWRGITANGNATIDYAHVDFSADGIKTSSSDFSINHSLFSKVGNAGVLVTHESTGTIAQNAFINCPAGIKVEGGSMADIENNIFLYDADNYYGTGVIVNASRATVLDNIFRGFNLGFTFENNTYGTFQNNYLENCTTGIYVNKASFDAAKPVVIELNIFKNCDKTVIDIFNCDSPLVEKNNFMQSSAHFLTGYAVSWQDEKSVFFPNNFWGSTEVNDILRRIDVRDNDSATQPYTVNIEPIAAAPIAAAGPR